MLQQVFEILPLYHTSAFSAKTANAQTVGAMATVCAGKKRRAD